MTIHYQGHGVTLHHGDCLDVLRTLPDASVDSVVTDPPYGLEFMGKEWDKFDGGQQARWQGRKNSEVFGDGSFKGLKTPAFGKDTRQRKCLACGHYPFSSNPCKCESPDLEIRTGTPPNMAAFQQWCELWTAECLRVLKPGGHLLAFGGARTWHRLACAVEDAGFEVRDSIAWLYGSGFSKGGLLGNKKGIRWCECEANALPYNHANHTEMHRLRQDVHEAAEPCREGQDANMLTAVQREAEGRGVGEARAQGTGGVVARGGGASSGLDARGPESRMEGWQLRRAGQGLQDDPHAGTPTREGQRLRGGAPSGDGGDDRPPRPAAGGGASHQQGPRGQQAGEPEAVPGPHGPLDGGALRGRAECPRCGGFDPRYRGFSVTLKPAFEPVVVARKPLSGTVAATVLAHGTGALNIDGCRINPGDAVPSGSGNRESFRVMEGRSDRQEFDGNPAHSLGRWPANVVLDESQAAELDAQTGVLTSGSWDGRRNGQKTTGILGEFESRSEAPRVGDSGGASRFFPTFRYEAKAPTAERPRYKREGGSDNATTYGQMKKRECNVCGNRTCPAGGDQSGKPWPTCGHNDWSWVEQQSARDEFVSHPTVKPLSLMRWLVRLVTPPGGTVLEPFAGSGTTVEACIVEGFACIAIEKGDEYLPLIMQRIHRRRDPVAAIRQTGDELGLFELDGEGA